LVLRGFFKMPCNAKHQLFSGNMVRRTVGTICRD
jgi:hypothetical protein